MPFILGPTPASTKLIANARRDAALMTGIPLDRCTRASVRPSRTVSDIAKPIVQPYPKSSTSRDLFASPMTREIFVTVCAAIATITAGFAHISHIGSVFS